MCGLKLTVREPGYRPLTREPALEAFAHWTNVAGVGAVVGAVVGCGATQVNVQNWVPHDGSDGHWLTEPSSQDSHAMAAMLAKLHTHEGIGPLS